MAGPLGGAVPPGPLYKNQVGEYASPLVMVSLAGLAALISLTFAGKPL